MYRKFYQKLLQWKNEEQGKCAIMIDGARRVGKSYIAQEFAKNKLYFYSKSDNEEASSRMEIDFLITKNKVTARHNIQGIEVKSTKRYTLSSLNKFKAKYAEYAGDCFVLHTSDFREDNDIIYLPVYMTMFL